MKKTVSILLTVSVAIGGIAIAYAKDRKPELPVQAIGHPPRPPCPQRPDRRP